MDAGTGPEDPAKRLAGRHSVKLKDQALVWPTPSAQSYGTNQGGAAGRTGAVRPSLQTLGAGWQTSRASDGEKGGPNQTLKGQPALTAQARAAHWPTATATDAKASRAAAYSTESGRHSGTTLTDAAVRSWPTPAARDSHSASASAEHYEKRLAEPRGKTLPEAIALAAHQDRKVTGAESIPASSRLNPAFVEWLMGWPEGWSLPFPRFGPIDSDSSEMGSYQPKPKKRSASSLKQSTAVPTQEHEMAKSRAELLKSIAEATASGGGNYIRDSRGRAVVKRTALESGFNGDRFVVELIIISSAPISVIALTDQNGQTKGAKLNIEPHAVGDQVSEVYMLGDPKQDPGFGKTKAFILALLNLNPLEVSAGDIAETMDDMDKNNGARGMTIDYSTRRIVTKGNGKEITVTDFSNVRGSEADGRQSDAEIAAMCEWMDRLLAPPAAAAASGAPARA